MRKNIMALLLAVALAFSLTPFAAAVEADEPPSFEDVTDLNPAKEDIIFCAEREFVKGYPDGTFKPNGNISRGEFVTVWTRTFNAIRQHDFNDVTKTRNEIDQAIIIMYAHGYINGVSSTEFSLNKPVNREMVAKVVENTYLDGIDGEDSYESYSDSGSISDWARNAVSVCTDKGVFDGVITDGKFEPLKPITRAEVCTVIHNLMKEPVPPPTKHNITISDTITGGTVTSDKTEAAEGETVTLTVTPADDMKLTEDSLKYNDTVITGTTFTMPDEDVTITAEFESEL